MSTNLKSLLDTVSEESSKFNIKEYNERRKLPILTDGVPSIKEFLDSPAATWNLVKQLPYPINGILSKLKIAHSENQSLVGVESDSLIKIAIALGELSIKCQSLSLALGIPLSDTEQVLLGALSKNCDSEQAIEAIGSLLFGVKNDS